MRTPAGTSSPHSVIVSLCILDYVRKVGQNQTRKTFSWEFRKLKLVLLTQLTNSKLRNINWSKVVRWLAEIPLDIDHPSSLDQKHILTNVDQSRPTLTNYLTNFDQYFVKSVSSNFTKIWNRDWLWGTIIMNHTVWCLGWVSLGPHQQWLLLLF